MRPPLAVSLELAFLTGILATGPLVPPGITYAAYLVVAQLAATYLVHCPAHYFVGKVVGIRFRWARLGRTTLARVLPARLAGLARLIPMLTLSTEKASITAVSRPKAAAMYASGTVASASSAFVIAAAATPTQPMQVVYLVWLVAVGYLLFDAIFSPKSGDLMKAREALGA